MMAMGGHGKVLNREVTGSDFGFYQIAQVATWRTNKEVAREKANRLGKIALVVQVRDYDSLDSETANGDGDERTILK